MARETEPNFYRQMAQGSAWALLLRWSIRGIGVISVVLLARLLTPADFGVVAMATVVGGLLMRLSEFGVGAVLIRQPNVARADCDTAWTIGVVQGLVVGAGVVLIAPYVAEYFKEPRLVGVMFALATIPVIEGFENIGMVLIRKELDFAKDFRIGLYTRVTGLAGTITLAFVMRNYWALVGGAIFASIAKVVISFVMHPYRPRLSLEKAHQYLRFAATAIPLSVGSYLSDRMPVLVGGRIASAADVGRLHVTNEISMLATEEVVLPIARVLGPSFARLLDDPKELRAAFVHVLAVTTAIALPIGTGLSAVAYDFTLLLLGASWLAAVPLIQMLTIRGAIKTISRSLTGNMLIATGHERPYTLAVWIEVLITVPLVIIGGLQFGIEGIAGGALLASLLTLPVIAYLPVRTLHVALWDMAKAVGRPVAACVVMYGVVRLAHPAELGSPVLRLLADVTLGATTYVGVVFALWWISGSPPGLERFLLRLACRKWVAIKGR